MEVSFVKYEAAKKLPTSATRVPSTIDGPEKLPKLTAGAVKSQHDCLGGKLFENLYGKRRG